MVDKVFGVLVGSIGLRGLDGCSRSDGAAVGMSCLFGMSLRRSPRIANNPVEKMQLGNAARKLLITTKSTMDLASIPDAAVISRPWTDCRANTLAQTFREMLSRGSPCVSFSSRAGEGLVGGEGSLAGEGLVAGELFPETDVEEDDDIADRDDKLTRLLFCCLSLPPCKTICA